DRTWHLRLDCRSSSAFRRTVDFNGTSTCSRGCLGAGEGGRGWQKGLSEDLTNILDKDELHVALSLFRHILHILLVENRKHHFSDLSTMPFEDLLLYTADRQDISTKRYLAGHCHILSDRAVG